MKIEIRSRDVNICFKHALECRASAWLDEPEGSYSRFAKRYVLTKYNDDNYNYFQMDWKEHLKKIKAKAKENLEKEEAEAEVLAFDLAEKIEEARDILKQFGSVSKARVRVSNERHKEIDPESGETFYAGGVLIAVRKKTGLLGHLFKKKTEPLIARLKFPHPAAILNQEGFEDCVEFIYSDTSKKATISEFSAEWLKQNLEVAYSLFIDEQKIV